MTLISQKQNAHWTAHKEKDAISFQLRKEHMD